MMRWISCILFFMTLLALNAESPKWPNPLILQRADPWIYKAVDGHYYFTASVPAYDRIELRSADSLAGLASAEPRTIWRRH